MGRAQPIGHDLDATTPERVGFVGIGNQGGPIALRIRAGGFPLTVWARRPEARAPFQEVGAVRAGSLGELGRSCSMVAVCVTTDDDVRAVTLGPEGLLAAMGSGTSLAVHSTVHPATVRSVAEAAGERNVTVLDAPVSGGGASARAGTMAVLLGGSSEVVERWRPVLSTFATSIEVLGDVGAGQLAKLVNNALSAVTLGSSLQALGAASELGLDRDAVYRVLTALSGDSSCCGERATSVRGAPRWQQPGSARTSGCCRRWWRAGTSMRPPSRSAADVAVTHLDRLSVNP